MIAPMAAHCVGRWASLGALALAVSGCSGAEDGGDSGSSRSSSGSGDGVDDGIFFLPGEDGTGGGDDVLAGFQACASESVATESVPLDIYVMFDVSCSMSCDPTLVGPGLCCPDDPNPRMAQVRQAVSSFLNAPESRGIGVGLGYFGDRQPGMTSCDPADYSRPDVPIAALPDNIEPLTASLDRAVPTGETPTGAAIRGACQYAQGWQLQHPAHRVVILLVTDGVPEAPVSAFCNPTLDDAAQAARDCVSAPPSVSTYVLGVGGNLDNLAALAEAGGTGDAYLVGPDPDVTEGVLRALTQIRDAAAVPCEFQVPPAPGGQEIDPALVNVTFQRASGERALVGAAGSAEGCEDTGGWYYPDPREPSTVRLCPSTCDEVTTHLIAASVRGRSARIDLAYGCSTVVIPR
jgi:hypothetical protein